jgi:hypothetical protein
MGTLFIVHDTDRDGWGSVALLSAGLQPSAAVMRQVRDKQDVVDVLNRLPVANGDQIYVLDLPAPLRWERLMRRDGVITWVDHHLSSWQKARPEWLNAVLPSDDKATTTMKLLVQAELVKLPNAMDFIRGLCRRSPPFDWGLLFDVLADGPPDVENFFSLLKLGPLGEPVPSSLSPWLRKSEETSRIVEKILAAAPTQVSNNFVVCTLADAKGIKLRLYSIELERRHPGCVRVLVHRNQLLYVGRDSAKRAPDLLAHFRKRGLSASGHPYVCFVKLRAAQIDAEIAALRAVAQAGV